MSSQKAENLLNLSLDATEEERERSVNLGVGFDPGTKVWELIVKYTGSLESLRGYERVTAVELANGYAILTVPQDLLETVIALPEIEYVEKPKRLFFAVNRGKIASCVPPVQTPWQNLLGEGVLTAILDSGIDYSHADFRREDGATRILALWDQTVEGNPPKGYRIGTEYTKEQIDEALRAPAGPKRYAIVPSRDLSGHGTAVAGICCGGGMEEARYRGVAPRSGIIAVKLGNPMAGSFPRTTELMQALDYSVKKGLEYGSPVAINISFGNTYGSHDGTSLLETFIDSLAGLGKTSIVVGTGNEGGAAGHVTGTFQGMEPSVTELSVGPYETGFSVQIWKNYVDIMDLELIGPGGRRIGPIQKVQGPQRFTVEGTEILLYYGEPSPYSAAQEIYLDFLPAGSYVTEGIWTFRLIPRRLVVGTYDMWLPSAAILNPSTRFLRPTPDISLTIPSTASKVLSVGAYDVANQSYAAFSGRGYIFTSGQEKRGLVKPDLAAPGVGVMTARAGGGYGPVTGTSFATPFVTGAAALLMEWGIVRGNDPYLYGEKVRAYLIRGTRQFPASESFPNPLVGYGALCVGDSLP